MFKRNEGTLDRTARLALGIVLLPAGLLALGALQGGVLGLLAVGFGVIALVTGMIGFCPTYVLFGVSTLEAEKEESAVPVKGS